jgi:hypothetical protein
MMFVTNKNQSFLEEWQMPDIGQKLYKIRLEHLVTQENKNAIRTQRPHERS